MSEASANNKNGSARWTDDLRTQFIFVLVEKTNLGVYTDTGFKSADWKWIMSEFNDRTRAGFEKSQLQSQYAELKKKFGIVSDLKSNSGFGWDYEKDLPTAPEDVWQRYIAAHAKAAPFRYTSLRNYDELEIVFSGKCATGEWAISTGSMTASVVSARKDTATPLSSSTDDSSTPLSDLNSVPRGLSGSGEGARHDSSTASAKRQKVKRECTKDMAIVMLEKISSKKSRIQIALELFSETSFSKELSVIERLRLKRTLAEEGAAELFLSCDDEERLAYMKDIIT
jgi:hypothetical protein